MPTVRTERVANELRRLRGSYTSTDVQRALSITPSKLSRIEAGKVRPSPEDARRLATYYGADSQTIERLVAAAEQLKEPGWWKEFVGPDWSDALTYHLELESEATKIESWTIDLVPGLLQVPTYITALVSGRADVPDSQLEQRLQLRARRQERVQSGELELWAVMSETVLHQEIGGAEGLRQQLNALAQAPSNVTIQIMPFTVGAHTALGSIFHILRFADWPAVVYQDTIAAGLYRDSSESVETHQRTMEDTRAAALSPRASREMLTQRVAELEG